MLGVEFEAILAWLAVVLRLPVEKPVFPSPSRPIPLDRMAAGDPIRDDNR